MKLAFEKKPGKVFEIFLKQTPKLLAIFLQDRVRGKIAVTKVLKDFFIFSKSG
jgi:hypothetical protein